MPGDKKDFGSLLRNPKAKPLVKGPPVQLSTESQAPASSMTEESAQVHQSTNAQVRQEVKPQVKRTSQGLRLRSDLLRAMKRIAFDEERHLYEVMEEAMEEYIERRKEGSSNNNA